MSGIKVIINDIAEVYDIIADVRIFTKNFKEGTFNFIKASCEDSLTIGYSGEEFSNYKLDVNGDMIIKQDGYISGNLFVEKATTINSSILIAGNADFNKNVTVYENTSLGSNLYVDGNTYINGFLTLKNDLTSYSDRRIKKNIKQLDNCLDKITTIRGYTFERIDIDNSKTFIGLIAQEIEEPFPELVTELDGIKTVNYQAFTGVLLECIQELKEKIAILENKILR